MRPVNWSSRLARALFKCKLEELILGWCGCGRLGRLGREAWSLFCLSIEVR